MSSPNRDEMKAGSGKLLKDDDSVFDLTALWAKLDSLLDAVNGLKVDATIETGDIEIGAVELKNASDDQRASIEAANVARTTATKVLATQPIDASGNVMGRDAANTARTTGTLVNPTQNVDQAGTVAANITSGADAVSNTQTRLGTSAWIKAFNGTTWDRIRSAVTTVSSTLTGFLNTLPWSIYHASPTTRTDGQGGPLESDTKGNMQTNLNTLISGENQGKNRLMMTRPGLNTRITTNTTTTPVSGTGILAKIIVEVALTGTVTVYDNTAASGTIMTILPIGTPAGVYAFDSSFSTGCTVVTSAADRIVVVTDLN